MNTAIKNKDILFTDSAGTAAKTSTYIDIDINVRDVLESWKGSLFAFEWMNKGGTLKALDELAPIQRQKRLDVETAIKNAEGLPKPVLGIGMLGTVEIGANKAVFLTLAALGHDSIPVQIREKDRAELKNFIIK